MRRPTVYLPSLSGRFDPSHRHTLPVVEMFLGRVAACPIWRSRPRHRTIVTGIVEFVVTKTFAIALISRAGAVPGAMRRSGRKVVRVKSAVTAIGVRILAGRVHVSRLLGFLRFT